MSNAAKTFPPQIKYIVGNEGCERYSYYGMRAILILFLTGPLRMTDEHGSEVMHLFMAFCYLFPLLGGLIADRYWGRYKTILWLSLLYTAGHAVMSLFEQHVMGTYIGLTLIALGSGAIKPCVSAFMGDQFKKGEESLITKAYNLFYFIINFGSFFSTAITPLTYEWYGPTVAFGIPGILMLIATIIFWMGRDLYEKAPPSGDDPDGFWDILLKGMTTCLKFGTDNKMVAYLGFVAIVVISVVVGMKTSLSVGVTAVLLSIVAVVGIFWKTFWSYAEKNHPKRRTEEFMVALNIFKVFACVSVFWALFDQHASTWVLQAQAMDLTILPGGLNVFGWQWDGSILAAQVSAINPILVMSLIPFNVYVFYPFLAKLINLTPLKKMTIGFFFAAAGFLIVALIQYPMDAGQSMNVLWQFLPYTLMTQAEVMISVTGLEFAYTQAPKSMKSTIMSLWLLTVFFGNIIAGVIMSVEVFKVGSGNFFLFFAVLILLAGFLFSWIVKNYKMRSIAS